MRIFGVGRNYAEHIDELKNERPDQPIIFMKPDTALIHKNKPFKYPSFSTQIHYEVELVLRLSRRGKNIQEEYAHTYFDAIGIGIDFTARDIQQRAKEKGLPWFIAKGFDGSAPISDTFIPVDQFNNLRNIAFRLEIDGKVCQEGNTSNMLFSLDYLVAYISQFFTLRTGDLIFTGTPHGVGPVALNNKLVAYIENKKLLTCAIV